MSDIFNKDQKWPAFGQPYFDPRLTQGLATLFEYPTLVQHQAIPALCRGRNLLMKAKTGSGKTVAYLAPAIQRCLSDARKKPMMVCILVPSRELVAQCVEVANSLLRFCFEDLEVDSCVGTDFKRVKAEIFVSTPTTLLKYIQYMEGRSKTRFNPGMIVIDEADLLFSYGFQKDLTTLIQSYFPKTYQAVLVSATLSANVEALRGIFLHKEVVIRVSDPKNEEAPAEVIQQMVRVFPDRVDSDSCFINKMATLFYLLRVDTSWMKHGKNALIFVSNVEKAYQVKLFLEQFREKVGIIHQEMSSAARLRSIKAFNQKVTRILVATDQVLESDEKLQLLEADSDEAQEFGLEVHEFGAEEPEMVEMEMAEPEQPDIDYVAHRGLDFQGVALVLNFDLPKSFKSYIHRIGRTGRGGATGVAISLVAVGDDECLSNFSRIMAGVDGEIQEHEVPQANVNRFMYRIEDACARLKKSQLKDYRVKELQNEALTSQELEEHFKNRPEDREALEKRLTDMQKRTRGRAKHSTFLPTYLLPPEHLLATTGVQRAIQTQMKADGEALQSVVGSKLESYYQRQRKAKSGFTEEKPAESSRYTREKMIRRSKNASCVDELQPLSNRKLWKLNHSRKIRKTHFEAIPFKIKKKDPLKFRPKKQAAKPKK